jgi:hypothetical protein
MEIMNKYSISPWAIIGVVVLIGMLAIIALYPGMQSHVPNIVNSTFNNITTSGYGYNG